MKSIITFLLILSTAFIANAEDQTFIGGYYIAQTAYEKSVFSAYKKEIRENPLECYEFSLRGKIINFAPYKIERLYVRAAWFTSRATGAKESKLRRPQGYPQFIKQSSARLDKDGAFAINEAFGNELVVQIMAGGIPLRKLTFFITKEQRHGFVRLCEDKPIIFDLNNQLHTSSTTPTESYELITYIEDPIDTSILSDLDNRSTNDAPSLVDRITESETPYVFLRASILLGRFDVTDLLQERGYTLNIVDQAELSLVHIAVLQNRNMEALNYLISNGAPLSYLDASGLTPLDYAIRLGYPDQAKLLESAGAKTREHRLSEKWFGLGLKLRANRGMIEVQSFSTQSPAQNSGQINIGDVLLEVNGVELTNKSLCFASQRIRGADQSLIELRIQSPDGSIRECTLTRGEFHDHPLPLEQAKD